jgi:hypothetical protein
MLTSHCGVGRPPTLPSQEFRPKQSLGQNFLCDQNYVMKIVQSLVDTSPGTLRRLRGMGRDSSDRYDFAADIISDPFHQMAQ